MYYVFVYKEEGGKYKVLTTPVYYLAGFTAVFVNGWIEDYKGNVLFHT